MKHLFQTDKCRVSDLKSLIVDQLNAEQTRELNRIGTKYGLESTDFVR